MIYLCEKDCCTGCEACAHVCRKNAIRFETDAFGFFYPSIDRAACVQCGMCQSVCPMLTPPAQQSPHAVYTYSGNLELRKACSSGGFVARLAQYAYEQGFYIAGVVFEDDFLSAKYVVTRSWPLIEKMRKSKYVSATIGSVYEETKRLLKNGEKVLFTGLPCHIAALNGVVGSDREGLYTLDLICHGTGAPGIYKSCVNAYCARHGYRLEQIQGVDFRPKPEPGKGKKNFSIRIDGKDHTMPSDAFPYYFGFNQRLLLRDSCYSCPFHSIRRVSDITAGDALFEYDENGSSLIMVNSDAGDRLIGAMGEEGLHRISDTQWPDLEKRFLPKYHPKNRMKIKRCKNYLRMESTYLNPRWVPWKSKIKRLVAPVYQKIGRTIGGK